MLEQDQQSAQKPLGERGVPVEAYRKAATLLPRAAKLFDVPTTDSTNRMWEVVLVAIKHADDRIDDTTLSPDERRVFIQQSLQFLTGDCDSSAISQFQKHPEFAESMGDLRSQVAQAAEPARNRFMANLTALCELTQDLKQEHDAREFARKRRKEGMYTTEVLLDLMPDGARASVGFENFRLLLMHTINVIFNADSIADLKNDTLLQQASVEGSVFDIRKALFKEMLPDLQYMKDHFPIASIPRLVWAALLGLWSSRLVRSPQRRTT